MRWLTQIFVVGAKLTFYVVVLAWVVIGQIKTTHFVHPDTGNKGPKASSAASTGETPTAAG